MATWRILRKNVQIVDMRFGQKEGNVDGAKKKLSIELIKRLFHVPRMDKWGESGISQALGETLKI